MVFGERGHVAVDFFARLLPRPGQRITAILVEVSILLFAALGLVWGGLRGMAISWDQAIPGLPVTAGQMYLALPIAGVIIALFALEDLVRSGRGEGMLAGDDAQTEAALDAAGAGPPEPPSSPSGQKGACAVDPAAPAGVILGAGVVVLIVVGAPLAIAIGLPS